MFGTHNIRTCVATVEGHAKLRTETKNILVFLHIMAETNATTKKSPSSGINDVRLLQRIRALKEKCSRLENERNEAEDREQRLRDTLETEIANALERRSRSMVEKVKAADASKGRSKKELQQLRKELRETHEMFKNKLNKERDVKMVEVTKNEKLQSQLATAKEAINRLKAALRNQEGEFIAETNSKEELLSSAEAELRLQAVKMDELKQSFTQDLAKEKELRYNAETKKRTAMHKLKEIKEKLSASLDARVKLEEKYKSLQERLQNSLTQSKQRLNMVKSAQATVREMKINADKQMEEKDKECRKEAQKAKTIIKTLKNELQMAKQKCTDVEEKFNETLKKDEQFRKDRAVIENERDEAKQDILKYIELGERCQKEVAIAEDKIRVMQGKLEDAYKWRQEKDLTIQELEGKLTLQEIKYGTLMDLLDSKTNEFEVLKEALNSRGISLDFVLRTVAQNKDGKSINKENRDNKHHTPALKNKNISKENRQNISGKKIEKVRSPARPSPTSLQNSFNDQAESIEFLKRSRDGLMPEEMGCGLWNRR